MRRSRASTCEALAACAASAGAGRLRRSSLLLRLSGSDLLDLCAMTGRSAILGKACAAYRRQVAGGASRADRQVLLRVPSQRRH